MKKFPNHKGISLIEVLVSVLILSITLSAFYRSMNRTQHNLIYLYHKQLAHWHIENLLISLYIEKKTPSLGHYIQKCPVSDIMMECHYHISDTKNAAFRKVLIRAFYDKQDIAESSIILPSFYSSKEEGP